MLSNPTLALGRSWTSGTTAAMVSCAVASKVSRPPTFRVFLTLQGLWIEAFCGAAMRNGRRPTFVT